MNWLQRTWPERTVKWWSEKDQEVYFRAAAIVLENVKELNPDLTYEELVTPRREIVLPTTPYRISLSYDRVKQIQVLSAPLLRAGERVELTDGTLVVLRDAGGKSLRDFADFLEANERAAEDHGELIAELKRLYNSLYPAHPHLETTIRLRQPIIGIGAPAGILLPAVARALHTELILPEHYQVANAVGAIAGSVMVEEELLIYPRLSRDGLEVFGYYVQAQDERHEFEELNDALSRARALSQERALRAALRSGADNPQVTIQETTDGLDTYRIRAKAIGNPRLAQ